MHVKVNLIWYRVSKGEQMENWWLRFGQPPVLIEIDA